MTWADVISRCLQIILEALLPVAVAVLAAYVHQWLKQRQMEIEVRLSEHQKKMLREAVELAVKAAEQSGLWDKALETGKAKKEFALSWASRYLEEFGLTLDLETLSGLIEAAVWDELTPWDSPRG